MDFSFSMGGLIPLWILGGPLLAGLIVLVSLPKPKPMHRDLRDTLDARDTRVSGLSHNPLATGGLSAARL